MSYPDGDAAPGYAPERTEDDYRIRFGPKPSQTIPPEWAEVMLTELRAKNPALFGRLLVKATTGGDS